MLLELCVFAGMLSMCVVYVSLGSSVAPNSFWYMFMGRVMSICRCSLDKYSVW